MRLLNSAAFSVPLIIVIALATLIAPPSLRGQVSESARAALDAAGAPAVEPPPFVRGTLNFSIGSPTSLAFGPDGRLYVAGFSTLPNSSEIWALSLDPATHRVLDAELIASGLEDVMGIAFDPTAPPSPVKVYASRREISDIDGFESRISTFTAPDWARADVITGLPTSRPTLNHLTNGLAFDGQGRLFIAQGSSTDAGLTDFYWPETPLSAAILVADVNEPGFDGGVTYTPEGPPADDNVDQISGDVEVFASGLRNPFDLVVHSNGLIYATDNGAMGPFVSAGCTESAAPSPFSYEDELNLVEEGNYYGHPNRNRGRSDPRQCTYRPPGEPSGSGYTAPISVLPAHCSCDGIVEYTADSFSGALQGDLVHVEFTSGNLKSTELSPDGRSVVSTSTLAGGWGVLNVLDVTMGPDGALYVTEFSRDKISYLAPDSDRDGCTDSREIGALVGLGGERDPNNFWDFYDVPTGVSLVRDGEISGLDIFGVILHFNTTDSGKGDFDRNSDPLSTPNPFVPGEDRQNYHPAFDRGPPVGPNVWNQGPADGAVAAPDIFAVIAQFGHTCT